MPQPLSRVRSNVSYEAGAAVIEKFPKLAIMILQCISAVAEADRSKGLILACMLGHDAHIGLRMYMALPSAIAKDAALLAAAEAYLPDEDLEVLKKIKKTTKAAFNERNAFAHCRWGYAPDLPGAALLIPGKEIGAFVDKTSANYAFALADLVSNDKILVYRVSDLKAALKKANRAARLYSSFHAELFHRRHTENDGSENNELFASVQEKVNQAFADKYAQLKNELHIS